MRTASIPLSLSAFGTRSSVTPRESTSLSSKYSGRRLSAAWLVSLPTKESGEGGEGPKLAIRSVIKAESKKMFRVTRHEMEDGRWRLRMFRCL